MGDTGSDSVSSAVVSAFSPVASGSKNLGSSIPTSNLALPPQYPARAVEGSMALKEELLRVDFRRWETGVHHQKSVSHP